MINKFTITILLIIGVLVYLMWPSHNKIKKIEAEDDYAVVENSQEAPPAAAVVETPKPDAPTLKPAETPPPPVVHKTGNVKKVDPRKLKVKLPRRTKKYNGLLGSLARAKFFGPEDILNGLKRVDEFRAGADEAMWNGNYYGELGWTDRTPRGTLKPEPAVINLEFKRANDASPLTCMGIYHGQRLLRFTKAAGKFVPYSAPNRSDYFVFKVGDHHFLQVLLSEDHQGLAATFYFNDPAQGLIVFSTGQFKKNESPTAQEVLCD